MKSDKKSHKWIWTIIIACLPVCFSGCTAAVLGVGESAYNHLRGDLLGIVSQPLDPVYAAAVDAVGHMDGYEISEREINAIEGNVTAYDPKARKVTIALFRTENNQTRIQIRIGLIGDKYESVQLYDRIRQSLKEPRESKAVF